MLACPRTTRWAAARRRRPPATRRRRRRAESWRERLGALRNLPPFLEARLADQPDAHARPGRAAPRPRAAAGGHALRRQADHRRGRAAGAGAARADDLRAVARERPARPHRLAARAGVRAGGALRRAGPRRLAARLAAVGAVQQRDQPAADGARRDARPRGLRGQRAAGPARARAPPGGGPHRASSASCSARRRTSSRSRASPPGSSSTRRGSSCCSPSRCVPAFIGEAHFNAQSYSLNYARTPERRELDYVRQTGASVGDGEGSEDLRPQRAS